MVDAESALERSMSAGVVDGQPRWRRLRAGDVMVQQGERGSELYLLFGGVLQVEIDDEPVRTVGPGALVGEQAALGDGVRTATLRALTACRVGVFAATDVPADALRQIARARAVPVPSEA